MSNFGTREIVIVFLVILILFGANKIPELINNIAKLIKKLFKKSEENK